MSLPAIEVIDGIQMLTDAHVGRNRRSAPGDKLSAAAPRYGRIALEKFDATVKESRYFDGLQHTGYLLTPGMLITRGGCFNLPRASFFTVAGELRIRGGAGFVVSDEGYRGMIQVGGPIESTGRLAYIDGCSDTLLVAPLLLGDPCLNHLHFPPGISQTLHTHPSVRAGIVARGRGWAVNGDEERIALEPGMVWLIRPDVPHRFVTEAEPMDVIAWHPDSDTGPTHQNHPMINRTIVGHAPASRRPDLQTDPKTLAQR